jgi:ketosteroid isomerase-like protein
MKGKPVETVLLAAVLSACAPGERATTSLQADLAAIQDINERTLAAISSGDWQRLNALVDDDYVSIIGGAAVSGKERHEAGNRRFLEQWRSEEAWMPDETIVDGDLAFQRGSFTMQLTPRRGEADSRSLAGTYIHIYQRKPDGSWALTRAMAGTANE